MAEVAEQDNFNYIVVGAEQAFPCTAGSSGGNGHEEVLLLNPAPVVFQQAESTLHCVSLLSSQFHGL